MVKPISRGIASKGELRPTEQAETLDLTSATVN
ncbi:hypothetical protein RSAG8_01419, partial [Rhizoctonia solani AG-8 WAC10335]